MNKTLWLTASEQAAFKEISDSVKEGWEVKAETGTVEDTPEKRTMRLALTRLHDPKLLKLREKAQNASSDKELAMLLQETDLQNVQEDDLAELFFALGPESLTTLIGAMIKDAASDDDLEGIVSLTVIRNSLNNAFSPQS